MKGKFLVLGATLMLALTGCNKKNNEFVPDTTPSGDQTPAGDTTVHVESVSLNETTKTLEVGQTLQLTATVTPATATNKNVTWSATGDGVVSVDEGLVTALKAGTSVVTATSVDGSKTASCTVTVNPAATPVNIDFGEEATMAANAWVYWNDQDWCGSTVTVQTHSKLGNQLTFAYTVVTGNCDWGFQVFYKNSSLNEGASYRLTAKINSLVAGTVELNGTSINLVVGDNNVAVKYVEGGAAAASFKLVVPTSMGNNTFVISDWAWEGILDIPGAVNVDAEHSTISFSAVDGAANYLVKYYQSDLNKTYIDEETVAASGASLTKLAGLANGNYYVTVTAKSSLDAKYDSIESDYTLFNIGGGAVVPAGGPKTNIAGGVGEAETPIDTFVYWNDQGWCGSTVSVSLGNAYTEEGLVHIQYSATGACNFGLQIFYKNSTLTNGTEYTVSFKMKVAVAGVYFPKEVDPLNEINLTADTWTDVSYDYTETASKASLKICVPAQTAAENTIELKDFSWVAK